MKIVFLGDSVTDAAGQGYPYLVACKLAVKNPLQFEIFNRGVSGDKSTDILSRIERDCIELKPDLVTILCGVNDVSHQLYYQKGVDSDQTKEAFDSIIKKIIESLPETIIMIFLPFFLKGDITDKYFNEFAVEMSKRINGIKQVADSYKIKSVALQETFLEYEKKHTFNISKDGIHLNFVGHSLLSEIWIRSCSKIFIS